ncbi:MAG: SAM-dependent methyltransferase [Algoriphagus sp.]|nr:SAM-dependent methyltransferase [Algoriphagus sp.]
MNITNVYRFIKLLIPPIITFQIQKYRRTQHNKKKGLFKPNNSLIESFSQYQEDLIIDAIFRKEKGFYVDVGANDPKKFSNTNRFYRRGWAGINIEPQPEKIKLFEKKRNRDINLNIGIGTDFGQLDFYKLEIDTLSTFDKNTAINHCRRFKTQIKEVINVEVWPLKEVLKKYLTNNQPIDFLSIDTEGFDLKVLKSNDWDLYRPKIVLIEVGKDGNEIVSFLKSHNYELVYKNSCNFFFLDKINGIKIHE